jgi:hypothetical protein
MIFFNKKEIKINIDKKFNGLNCGGKYVSF